MDLRSFSRRAASTECKCSQPQILNVKWCEQHNALAEHGNGSRGTIDPLNGPVTINSRIVDNSEIDQSQCGSPSK
jgi:hypothetical protein